MKYVHVATRVLILPVILGVSGVSSVDAQTRQTPRDALEAIRRAGFARPAAEILAQDSGPRSGEELDRLADALVAIAVEFNSGDEDVIARKRAVGAVEALTHASSDQATVRYTGGVSRLKSIVGEGQDKPVRSLALQSIMDVTDPATMIPYLSDLATSPDAVADHAISMLVRYTGEAGTEELKRLYREKKVIEPSARELLSLIASSNDW